MNNSKTNNSNNSTEKYEGLKKHSKESNALVKDCIKTALISLAANKDYLNISVTELCKKAGVSRMAFYRNYEIINDVLHEIAVELNNRIINVVGSPFRLKTSKEWYIKAFQNISIHKETLTLMFKENFQHQWMNIVNEMAISNSSFSSEEKFQRLMWAGGFENAVSHWLNNGLTESPEEMAEYCITYLPHMLAKEVSN